MRSRDYAELRALATIVEQKSFVRAAKQLRITPSALSQTIRGLEQRLGVRLLNRTTRSVAASEAGATLLARTLPALQELDAALHDVSAANARAAGIVRINAPRAIAYQYIGPRLGAFHRAYPEITLEIASEDRILDIVASGYDAGIRLGERVDKDMVALKLGGDQQLVAVASPAYVAAHGAPRTPRELAQHHCINLRMPTNHELWRWEFERRGKQLEIAVDGPLIVSDVSLALEAARQGVGIAYLFRDQCEPAIEAGALVPLLESWSPPFAGFYLYYPGRKFVRPALRAVIDFLRKSA
jgi:DNA-binding transcriptional LysR family regulator